MSARANDVLVAIDALAPLRLAEPWDNVGLLLGDAEALATGVLLTIDLTPEVVQEAVSLGANVVVAYHPPIFRAQKTILARDLAYLALHHRLVVISPHTALDAARAGTCEVMAERLALAGAVPLVEKEPGLGQGRVGELATPMTADDFIDHVKRAFEVDTVMVAGHAEQVLRVAVGAGSFGGLLDSVLVERAPHERRIDAIVAGELAHHDALRVDREGRLAVLVRHSVSERPALASLAERLGASVPVPVWVSAVDRDPLRFV